MPEDHWVSLDARDKEGWLLTTPYAPPPAQLLVNADAEGGIIGSRIAHTLRPAGRRVYASRRHRRFREWQGPGDPLEDRCQSAGPARNASWRFEREAISPKRKTLLVQPDRAGPGRIDPLPLLIAV